MIGEARGRCARAADWWVRRNPAYLLSAAAMAFGARLLLVSPNAPAGDLQLIVTTLGVLVAYELAIAGIVICLHHARRGAEDLPTLLLVGTLFWTGPLCATIELTAHDAALGLPFSIAAAMVTLMVLAVVCRELGLALTVASGVIATACVLVLTVVPARMRVSYERGATDEALLFACWWVLAGLTACLVWVIRRRLRCCEEAREGDLPRPLLAEMGFIGAALVATAFHLYGMNYAFFAHAQLFYAAPALIAAALVGFELIERLRLVGWWCAAPLACLTTAMFIGFGDFHPSMAHQMAWPLNEPAVGAAMFTALVCWRACRIQGLGWMLHAGTAALVVTVYESVPVTVEHTFSVEQPPPIGAIGTTWIAVAGYTLTVYFAGLAWWRRSKLDATLAFACHAVAGCALLEPLTQHDVLVFASVGGWSWLIAVGSLKRHLRLVDLMLPVGVLVAVTIVGEFRTDLASYARLHGAVTLLCVGLAACVWRTRAWRNAAASATAALVGIYSIKAVGWSPHPLATGAVAMAFVMLAVGTGVSWRKRTVPIASAAVGEG